MERCVDKRGQGGLPEQRNHGHGQCQGNDDHRRRLAHKRHHQRETAATQYLARVDVAQANGHHREEEVDVVDERNDDHRNGDG